MQTCVSDIDNSDHGINNTSFNLNEPATTTMTSTERGDLPGAVNTDQQIMNSQTSTAADVNQPRGPVTTQPSTSGVADVNAAVKEDRSWESFSERDFDGIVPGAGGGKSTSKRQVGAWSPFTSHSSSGWEVVLGAVVLYTVWLTISSSVTCGENAKRSPFWFYIVFHSGVWFWFSLTGMLALFVISLDRQLQRGDDVNYIVLKASFSSFFGLLAGGTGLYIWHVDGDHMSGGTAVNLVSKTIVMSCVGLFGVLLSFLLQSPSVATAEKATPWREYIMKRGLLPVVLCCCWCVVWLLSEIFSQMFVPFTRMLERHLPAFWVPVFETAYVELYSVFTLPMFRLAIGYIERYFLQPGDRGPKETEYTHTIRVIMWIDLLFEGFRWMYNRIVFAKVKLATFILISSMHMFISMYTFYWKYSPHRTAARLAYFNSNCRHPPDWSLRMAANPCLRTAVSAMVRLGRWTDFLSSQIISSSHFTLNLCAEDTAMRITGKIGVMQDPRYRTVATLTVLNHRFYILNHCTAELPSENRVPKPLEFTELVAMERLNKANPPTANSVEEVGEPGDKWYNQEEAKEAVQNSRTLSHAHTCTLALQQHIEVRLRGRQCMRIVSSLVLLCTNLALGATDSELIRGPVGKLSEWPIRLWAFPVIMVMSDLFEMLCMWHSWQAWTFSPEAVSSWRKQVFGDVVFRIALLCLMVHLAMSPTYGRHTLMFCE